MSETRPTEPDATNAEQVVARLDSYSAEEHIERIEAARQRIEAKRAARMERARAAAARVAAQPDPADFIELAACDRCREQVPADELTDGRECGQAHCAGHRCLPCARDKAADR